MGSESAGGEHNIVRQESQWSIWRASRMGLTTLKGWRFNVSPGEICWMFGVEAKQVRGPGRRSCWCFKGPSEGGGLCWRAGVVGASITGNGALDLESFCRKIVSPDWHLENHKEFTLKLCHKLICGAQKGIASGFSRSVGGERGPSYWLHNVFIGDSAFWHWSGSGF